MSRALVKALEKVSISAKSGKSDATRSAVESARAEIGKLTPSPSLRQLETELGIWSSKLDVILNEPAGREGMAKHAAYWMETLAAKGYGDG